MENKYCLIYRPTGQICEVEFSPRHNGFVCFMTFATIEGAQLAVDEYGAENHSIGELPADIVAFGDEFNRLPYYHPFCKAAEAAWFDMYKKSTELQALDDDALAMAADFFTEGYTAALINAKKGN